MTKYLGTKSCSLMWLFFLYCFQKPYHINISDCSSSDCWGDVQWWADGGGVALARVWACIAWVREGGRVVKGPRRTLSLNYCFSHVLKFTCQGDINVNVLFRSAGRSSAAVASFPEPWLPSGPLSTASVLKASPEKTLLTQRPVLRRVPCWCDAGYKLWNISCCSGWWKITFLTWP